MEDTMGAQAGERSSEQERKVRGTPLKNRAGAAGKSASEKAPFHSTVTKSSPRLATWKSTDSPKTEPHTEAPVSKSLSQGSEDTKSLEELGRRSPASHLVPAVACSSGPSQSHASSSPMAPSWR